MQFDPSTFDRPNMSEELAHAVRAMIVDGRLPAGARVNEVHLAAGLQVSRTPLREALSRLASEGALQAVPRKGWFVTPMTVEELEQLYDVRPILDPEALRMGGVPPSATLTRLDQLNRMIEEATRPEQVIALDDLWHLTLLGACPNRVLVGMIEQLMMRTRRYELALMRERPSVDHTTRHHDEILAALRRGDLEAACAALKANMVHGREPILAWLRERASTPSPA